MAAVDVVRFRRHPSLPGMDLGQVRQWTSAFGPFVTASLTVALQRKGAVRLRYRGSSSLIHERGVVFLRPAEVHSATPTWARFDGDAILIDPGALSRFGYDPLDICDALMHNDPLSTSNALQQRFAALAEILADESAPDLLAGERAHSFVETLLRVYASRVKCSTDQGTDDQGIRRAREMIHDRFSEALTLDELAEVSGLPRFRFLRSFKRLVGLPPHAYQTRLRVDRARQLIAWGASFSDAAAFAGFSDQSHFHRQFARLFRVTPGEYTGRRTRPEP